MSTVSAHVRLRLRGKCVFFDGKFLVYEWLTYLCFSFLGLSSRTFTLPSCSSRSWSMRRKLWQTIASLSSRVGFAERFPTICTRPSWAPFRSLGPEAVSMGPVALTLRSRSSSRTARRSGLMPSFTSSSGSSERLLRPRSRSRPTLSRGAMALLSSLQAIQRKRQSQPWTEKCRLEGVSMKSRHHQVRKTTRSRCFLSKSPISSPRGNVRDMVKNRPARPTSTSRTSRQRPCLALPVETVTVMALAAILRHLVVLEIAASSTTVTWSNSSSRSARSLVPAS